MSEASDVYELLKKIRYDATAIQAKVTDALKALSDLNLPDDAGRTLCPQCGATLRGPKTLAEHVYNSHGGPVPAHYESIEAAALEPVVYGEAPA